MPCGFHLKRDRRGVGAHAAADRLEGDRGGPARQRHRARRLGLLLAARPAGHRRDRDAGRDLRPRGVRRDVAAGRLDAARLSGPVTASTTRPRADVRLPLVRPIVDDALARRPRGLGPALPGLPRQGRRELRSCGSGCATRSTARGAATAARSRRAAPARNRRPAPIDSLVDYYEARAGEYDDWYLRRGRYARGPIHDAAWNAELDARRHAGSTACRSGARSWSSRRAPAGGRRSSPSKGELWIYDAAPAPLDRARERLLAHGLRAHIHVRDAWAEPDRPVDALFCRVLAEPRRAGSDGRVPRPRPPLARSPAACSRSSTRCRIPSPARPTTRRPPTTRPSGGSTTAGSSRSSRSTASPPSSRPRSATPASRRRGHDDRPVLRPRQRDRLRRSARRNDVRRHGRSRPCRYSAGWHPSRTARSRPSAPASWPRR